MSVLDTIGRTSLLHLVPEESARILVKAEYENPTGSMKDRMARAMIEAALADGRLHPRPERGHGRVAHYAYD